jgi:Flp pilus assembly protein TadD
MSILFIVGFTLALSRFLRQAEPEWFLVAGMLFIFGLGVFCMSLRVPSYTQAKAFYAFPALLPLGALVAAGWDWLRRRHRAVGTALWVLLLVWTATVYAAFWIREGSPATYLVRGIYFINGQRYPEAVASLSTALRLKPDYAAVRHLLAVALMRQGKYDEAAAQFAAAIELQPGNLEAHSNLGIILAGRGLLDEAIGHLQDAVRFKPDDAEIQNNLGVALTRKRRFDDAIEHYREAINLRPDYAKAHRNLGVALVEKGQLDEAIAQFREAVRLKPDYAEVQARLRAALELKGNAGAQANPGVKP